MSEIDNIGIAKEVYFNTANMLGLENPFIDYDEIVQQVCQNVDDRIKFLAVLMPIVWMAGNWFEKKCHDNKFIQKNFSTKNIPIILPNVPYNLKGKIKDEGWWTAEMMSIRDIVLEFVVPCFRIMLLFSMGFMIYYTRTAGMG